jgi:hypothetical protein
MSFRSWLSRRKRQSLYTADPLSLAEKVPASLIVVDLFDLGLDRHQAPRPLWVVM